MKLTSATLILLAASLFCNLALWPNHSPTPRKISEIADNPKQKLTALVDDLPPTQSRIKTLRKNGLKQDQALAAIVLNLNQQLRKSYMSETSPRKLVRAGMKVNEERRQILRELSGGRRHRENVFDPHPIRLRYEFDAPRADTGELKVRDSGRGESVPPSDQPNAPLPGDKGIHEVLSRIGGVTLSMDQKKQLVEIAQANHSTPETRTAALAEAFDPETSAQLIRCFLPGYKKAYQRATSVSDDPAERIRFANALQEYVQQRAHPQRHERLLEALGPEGVAIVRAAKW